MLDLKTRTALASAAAMFALASVAVATPVSAADSSQKVACYGVNACKGQSDCKSGAHACKGQNSCKGQGFKSLTSAQCEAQHGSTTPPQ
jgi:uncharacterized membrane protein